MRVQRLNSPMYVHPSRRKQYLMGLPVVLKGKHLQMELVEACQAVRHSSSRFAQRPGLRFYLPSGYRIDLRHEKNQDADMLQWWELELFLWFKPQKPFFLHIAPENALTRGKPDWRCGDQELDDRYQFRSRQPEVLQALFGDARFVEQFRAEDQLRLFRGMKEHRLIAHDHLPRRVGALAMRLKGELYHAEAFAQRMVLLLRAAQVLQEKRWVAPLYNEHGRKAW